MVVAEGHSLIDHIDQSGANAKMVFNFTLLFMIISQVIVAEGEIKASLALRQAAENIAGSPESLQV